MPPGQWCRLSAIPKPKAPCPARCAPPASRVGSEVFSLWVFLWVFLSISRVSPRVRRCSSPPPPHPSSPRGDVPSSSPRSCVRNARNLRVSEAAWLGTDPQSSTRLLDREELSAMPLPCGDTATRVSPPAASVWSCERRNLRAQRRGGPVPLEAAVRCGMELPRESCWGSAGIDGGFTKREQGVGATSCTGCGHRRVVGRNQPPVPIDRIKGLQGDN